MDKRSLSERDICTKFITPALRKAGWDEISQIREEVSFTEDYEFLRCSQNRSVFIKSPQIPQSFPE